MLCMACLRHNGEAISEVFKEGVGSSTGNPGHQLHPIVLETSARSEWREFLLGMMRAPVKCLRSVHGKLREECNEPCTLFRRRVHSRHR